MNRHLCAGITSLLVGAIVVAGLMHHYKLDSANGTIIKSRGKPTVCLILSREVQWIDQRLLTTGGVDTNRKLE